MEITDYKAGDLVFFRDTLKWSNPMSWLATLIRFFAKVKYNHVGVITTDNGELFINEAVGKGIVKRSLSSRITNRKILVRRKISYVDEIAFSTIANSQIGKKYDYAGLLWFQLWYQLFKEWLGYKSPEKAANRFYCYEYAAWCHEYKDWQMVNPTDFISSNKFKTIYQN